MAAKFYGRYTELYSIVESIVESKVESIGREYR